MKTRTRVCGRISSITRHEVIRAAVMGTELVDRNKTQKCVSVALQRFYLIRLMIF
jgi:hypothetical protein